MSTFIVLGVPFLAILWFSFLGLYSIYIKIKIHYKRKQWLKEYEETGKEPIWFYTQFI